MLNPTELESDARDANDSLDVNAGRPTFDPVNVAPTLKKDRRCTNYNAKKRQTIYVPQI